MTHKAPQTYTIPPGKLKNISVSLVGQLESGVLLTGAPTAVEQVTSNLTIDQVARNTAQLTINKKTVAIDQAVQLRATGTVLGTYSILVSCGKNSTPAGDAAVYITVIIADSTVKD